MITLTLQYRLNGATGWTTVNTYQRPVTYSEKIDETLDFGQLVFQAISLIEIPPFTQMRLTAQDSSGNSISWDFLTADIAIKMVRAT